MRTYQQQFLAHSIAVGILAILFSGAASADEKKDEEKTAVKEKKIAIVVKLDGDQLKIATEGLNDGDANGAANYLVLRALTDAIAHGKDGVVLDGADQEKAKSIVLERVEQVQVADENDVDFDQDDEDDEPSRESSYRIGVAIAGTAGLLVSDVVEDSAAAKAGVRGGDVVLAVNGDIVGDVSKLIEGVQAAGEAGKPIQLQIVRGEEMFNLEVTPSGGTATKLSADDDKAEFPSRTRRRIQARVAAETEEIPEAIRQAIERARGSQDMAEEVQKKIQAAFHAQHEMHGHNQHGDAIRELREEIARLRADVQELKRAQRRDRE